MRKFTPNKHAEYLGDKARSLIVAKYLKGQKEHGGYLWLKEDLIDMAIEEAIDQVIYLLTLKDQLAEGFIDVDEGDGFHGIR